MAERKFELVQEPDPDPAEMAGPASRTEPAGAGIATDLILLGLQTLSKRTLVALSNLFCLLTVGSVFVLFYNIPNPSVLQIISLSIYALFVLAANAIVRRM